MWFFYKIQKGISIILIFHNQTERFSLIASVSARAPPQSKYESCNENPYNPSLLPSPAVTPAGKKRRTAARYF
jgi:hypothetical protein